MNEYHRIVTRIQEHKRERKGEHPDAISLMAFCTTVGVEVEVGFRHTSRRGYFVAVSLNKRDMPGIHRARSEERIPTNSWMRYNENRLINNTIVDLIEEVARKRRGA